MSRPRNIREQQALAAHRRDIEIRKAEELKKVASYYELNTNKSKHHEQWTAADYYERSNKEAELLTAKKVRAAQLEERRNKLEKLFFQENMQYQEELKTLSKMPKLYKNGSFINKVPTSTLKDINLGIIEKEEQLRKHEAELRLHHAWRMKQPELRAANSYLNNNKLKSAWMEQIIEKEMEKKKEEEETRKILLERDEALRRQIEIEEERLREKELQVQELRNSLEGQIAELSEKEAAVKKLRKEEEKERLLLDELLLISHEREKELIRLMQERDTSLANMRLYKYKLKRKVTAIIEEIEFDLVILGKLRLAMLKDYGKEQEKSSNYKRVLDAALEELREYRENEKIRQRNIETMYDGEARLINEKQDKLWAKEREAREALMKEVLSTLKKQVEEKIEANRQQQKMNVLERERILEQMDSFHKEVRAKERETKLNNSAYSTMASLQSQLNNLRLQQQKIVEAQEKETELREAVAHETKIRDEIAKMQREGTIQAWT